VIPSQRKLALVGCGAIGSAVLDLLRGEAGFAVTQVVVPAAHAAQARAVCARFAPPASVAASLDLGPDRRPDLVVECAGHEAVTEHVVPALRAGIPAVVASIGSLHDVRALQNLGDAATAGGAQAQLISGAIGGIDALGAARIGGLARVEYTGRKPPRGWQGTPAEQVCDLAGLKEPKVIFQGSAREAARLYPKNANVAATVSIAGLGMDQTRATLIADPAVTRNVHRVVAEGAFGRLDLTIENEPLAANPKTSALTVYSIVRAIHNVCGTIAI
jgi:aspartate dehydrogenase